MGKKNLSTDERNMVVQFIFGESINGRVPRGKLKEARLKFNISSKTVARIWAAAKVQQSKGQLMHVVSGQLNRKTEKFLHLDPAFFASIDLSKRGNHRQMAFQLGVSKTTVGRWINSGQIRSHNSRVKPDLTAANKLHRIHFSLEHLDGDLAPDKIKFKNMQNTVHIDEKWFYMTKACRRFYLAPGEADPQRTCKSKSFITKIMFICAVAKPLFATNGEVLFDSKIGIFPFTEMVLAKRNSKNRCKGTLEMKAINSVTKEVIKSCLINKILPAIMAKWPDGASKDILIQQDNARPHIADSDAEFRAAASINGFHIRLVQQPPNSPDCNINDLGWFTSIQALQIQTDCKNIEELLNAVHDSFNALSPQTLNNVFLSLQGSMIEIMKTRGENHFKQPHMGKGTLRTAGALPLNLEVPVNLIMECINYLKEKDNNEGLESIIETLQLGGAT